MLFGHHVIDRTVDEHVRDIAALVSEPQTLIFLDTNILSYLYKLHEAARREFFAWSDSMVNENRLVVPAWAASEYLSKVTSKTLDSYMPKSKEAIQATKLLNGLIETASLFVDDDSLRKNGHFRDRATFITDFRAAIDALAPFTRVFSQNFDSGVIHQQIEAHLSPAILDSDIANICVRATQEGPGRFEHRLPPGFRDETKTENRLGDLIIWFEILEKSKSSAVTFPNVLFISRDEKVDWVYAPKMRKELTRTGRKTIGNSEPQIKLADPRLVAEFRRVTGHANITIASIDTLVEGLSKANPALFAHLAAAIQINVEQSAPSSPAADTPVTPIIEETGEAAGVDAMLLVDAHPEPFVNGYPPDGTDPTVEPHPEVVLDVPLAPSPPLLQYDQIALRDREYQAEEPSDINEIIRALKSQNWHTQNPAIKKIRAIRQGQFSASSWFVLGRNIYQAACGNSMKAMELMAALESQLTQFPKKTAQHILAGMLFEIYFDSQGHFREKAKFSYADKPLALAAHHAYEEVRKFILFHLHHHRQRLKFLPGDRGKMALRIVSAPTMPPDESTSRVSTQELRSVSLNGVELMRDVADKEDDAWTRLLSRSRMSQDTLRAMVSEVLAIPKWALINHFEPRVPADVQFVVPNGRELHPRLATEVTGDAA